MLRKAKGEVLPQTQPATVSASFFKKHKRLLTILAVFLILFLLIRGWIGSMFEAQIPEVPYDSVLIISAYGPVVEYNKNIVLFPYTKYEHETLLDLIYSLKKAAVDERIEGVVIKFGQFSMGAAQAAEMRDAILSYKKSGKKIYAYSHFYSITDYYIASACDKVYTMPQGIVDLRGLSMTRTYIKDTLGKLGIKAQFVKIDEYKSAPEMFIENKGTKRDREQRMAFLNAVFDEYVTSISMARGIEKDEFTRLLEEGFAQDLLSDKKLSDLLIDRNIIDDVKYLNEVVNLFKDKKEKTQKAVWHKIYKRIPAEEVGLNQGPVIALVYATGTIVDGLDHADHLGGESAGSDTLSQQLRKARVDENVKAVVIRVDSPGGSGTASEAILHEINRIKDAGKPVVVSMGNVAASGGYYIACQADKIVAQPTTLTGSIGIFAGKFDMSGFYKMIGVNRETIKRGKYADFFSDARPATEDEMRFLHGLIKDFYDTFIQRVADGRGKTTEEVNKIGRGRIWSGVDAKNNGLVDELGGMDRAIEIAGELAGIKDEQVHLKLFPARKNLIEVLLGQAGKNTIKSGWASIPYLKFIPEEAYKILSLLYLFAGKEGFRIYALMPEIITVN